MVGKRVIDWFLDTLRFVPPKKYITPFRLVSARVTTATSFTMCNTLYNEPD